MTETQAAIQFAPIQFAPIQFVVLGQAQPGGSKKPFPNRRTGGMVVVDANPKAAPWKQIVAAVARQHYSGPLLDGPLRASFVFFRPRPKSHFRSGKNSYLLKLSAPEYPTMRPDALKLARSAEDALTGILWRDDAQIVTEILAKRWGEPARVEIVIEPAQTAAQPVTATQNTEDGVQPKGSETEQ